MITILRIGASLQRVAGSFNGRFLLTVFAFVILTATAAYAAPALAERNEDYTITGRTAVELRGQLDRLGPRDEADGKIYDANTRSELAVRYEYQTSLDSCRISSTDIRLSVVYVMPRWADYDGGPREVRESWDRYIANLILHEQGHRDVGMQVAADLERQLLDMRGRYCEEVGRAADEVVRSSFRILKEQNREYDTRTRHGAGQGTIFP